MPELPEVESARVVLAEHALDREIAAVDDTDTWVCRPHAPGEIADALVGGRLVAEHRRGKSLWCDTTDADGDPGPRLGIHLGMSGRLVAVGADGSETDGGDYWRRGRAGGDHRFLRFALTFADGGRLLLIDPRRLGRVRLDPPVDELGPDARGIGLRELRGVLAPGTAPVKARLLDQHRIAGVGNLLADEICWQAKVSPERPVDELGEDDVKRLHRATKRAVDRAIEQGGVHTLTIVEHRHTDGVCPRCGAELVTGTVGGRTTWWCPVEQV